MKNRKEGRTIGGVGEESSDDEKEKECERAFEAGEHDHLFEDKWKEGRKEGRKEG